MSRDALLLGVDGGGTSTEAWLATPGGSVLGRGRAGPSNAKSVGDDAARQALGLAIQFAFADARLEPRPASVACFGLAGFDRPAERSLLSGWVSDHRWAERLVNANDGDLVIAAGTPEGWGVGVIAGTGSIAVGRASDGRKARAGGWGPLIGDEGSGYSVVLAALREVARRFDGRARRSTGEDPLRDHLLKALGVPSPAEIPSAIHATGFDRARIASLATVVMSAFADDPASVGPILQHAGEALAEQVAAVIHALQMRIDHDVPLAMAGGFLLSAPPVTKAMLASLGDRGYRIVESAVPDPVRGAIVLAERAWGEA